MNDDLISRQDAVKAIDKHIHAFDAIDANYLDGLRTAMTLLNGLQSVQIEHPEQIESLTDKEQRIFLVAMSREEKVCKKVDDECRDCRELYEDSLVKICHEIIRKVKGALWTT